VAYKNGSDKADLVSKRIRPSSWLLLEVEIAKVIPFNPLPCNNNANNNINNNNNNNNKISYELN
jgi:hypothetical protein